MSGSGHFTTYIDRKTDLKRVRYVLATTNPDKAEAITKFGEALILSLHEYKRSSAAGKTVLTVQVSGSSLQDMISHLWPYLTVSRRDQYARLIAECREYNERQ